MEAAREVRKPRTWLDPIKEAKAVAALRATIADLNGDDELLADTIEGETSLFEVIDSLLLRMADSRVQIDGAAVVIGDLESRQARFKARLDTDRAMIEQAMMIAELTTVERPVATLSLANRPPKVMIETEADIPAEFWKAAEPTLDRKALLAALKERSIPGATLSNQAPSLTVRTR